MANRSHPPSLLPLGLRLSRLLFALLALAAVVAQGWHSVVILGLPATHYLSLFTVQSNLLTAVVMLLGGLRKAWLSPVRSDVLRGATVLYLVMTGVVDALLLHELPEVMAMMVPWADAVLHAILPLWVMVDWQLMPPSTGLAFRRARAWLLYPCAYMVYSVGRGAVVQWYPYPFLNPGQPGGVAALLGYCTGISLFGLLFAAVIMKAGQWRYRNRHEDSWRLASLNISELSNWKSCPEIDSTSY